MERESPVALSFVLILAARSTPENLGSSSGGQNRATVCQTIP